MELWEAMEQRHSVRAYQDRPIAGEVKEELEAWIAQCNQEGGLHMQLILDEPRAFSGGMARYGKFSGVRNYIAVVGPKGPGLEEACGYYGEKVVLKAQQLGLNTCWVALTYRKVKTAFTVAPGEKLCLVIAIGYGKNGRAAPPGETAGSRDAVPGVGAELVPPRGAGGFAGPHGHEPAEVPVPAGGLRGAGHPRAGILHQNRPGHRQVPL